MPVKRTDRLNSLLKEVISEVIRRDVKNPHVDQLVTVTRVDITKDLRYAKVFVSVIGEPTTRMKSVEALQSASGFIGKTASKKVVMRYFPSLTFYLDDSLDAHMRIDTLLNDIDDERQQRQPMEGSDEPREGKSA